MVLAHRRRHLLSAGVVPSPRIAAASCSHSQPGPTSYAMASRSATITQLARSARCSRRRGRSLTPSRRSTISSGRPSTSTCHVWPAPEAPSHRSSHPRASRTRSPRRCARTIPSTGRRGLAPRGRPGGAESRRTRASGPRRSCSPRERAWRDRRRRGVSLTRAVAASRNARAACVAARNRDCRTGCALRVTASCAGSDRVRITSNGGATMTPRWAHRSDLPERDRAGKRRQRCHGRNASAARLHLAQVRSPFGQHRYLAAGRLVVGGARR